MATKKKTMKAADWGLQPLAHEPTAAPENAGAPLAAVESQPGPETKPTVRAFAHRCRTVIYPVPGVGTINVRNWHCKTSDQRVIELLEKKQDYVEIPVARVQDFVKLMKMSATPNFKLNVMSVGGRV